MEGTVVDVRSPQEFMGGHVEGSVNIPLNEVSARIEEIKSFDTPILLCCASGNRSAMATQLLTQEGVECRNAGSWMEVNYLQSQNR